MTKLLDWLVLAAAWITLLLAVAGLLIAASEWKRRHDTPPPDVDNADDLG